MSKLFINDSCMRYGTCRDFRSIFVSETKVPGIPDDVNFFHFITYLDTTSNCVIVYELSIKTIKLTSIFLSGSV